MTQRVGLLGWPVGHSISPAMHNAAFHMQAIDWAYTALPVPPEELQAEVTRLLDEGYRGFNVTVPHKQAVLELAQIAEVSPAVDAISAANTLTRLPGGSLRADNTDWEGFLSDLRMYRVALSGQTCLILGTGGSARAVRYALEQQGVAVVQVSRQPDRHAGQIGYDDLAQAAEGAGLIVNCTPLGLAPEIERSPWPKNVPFPPGAILYDLVYNPPVTRLMQQARAAGARVFGGLGMLVWQGALSYEIWTGQRPQLDIMFAAARQALSSASSET